MATNTNRILSIDVERVATSYPHKDRTPCSVAVVNDQCQILYNSLITPTEKIIYPLFDSDTIIVGQNPKGDIKWLKLEKDVHYSSITDLSGWFKIYNPRFGSMKYMNAARRLLNNRPLLSTITSNE